MKKFYFLILINCLLLQAATAQTRLYLEAFGGGNISFSKFATPYDHPGLHKYNSMGVIYGLLAGYRIGTYLYLESGVMKPFTAVKFKLTAADNNATYTRSYAPRNFLFPLLLRKNFSLNKQKFFLRLGGAFNKMSRDTFPDQVSNWPADGKETSYRQYNGSDIYVCLLSSFGYSRRVKGIGEFSLSLMYAEGLTEIFGQWVDYTFDNEIHYTHNIYNRGSFLSLQLGARLFTSYYKKPAKFPWPARREIE